MNGFTRRTFLLGSVLSLAAASGISHAYKRKPRILFTSQGRTGIVDSDGANLRFLMLKMPNQVTWQPGPAFSDGRRLVMLSMEERRDGPGKPFDEFYTQTPTHLWVYNLESGDLREIATVNRLAAFYTPALLVGENRILVQVVRNRVGQIVSMNLDGSDAKDSTRPGEGLPYGLSLSPDHKRVAFHLAGPRGYEVWTSDVDGGNRVRVAGHPDHLYFGTAWSPDGKWVLYQDCRYKQYQGHDWSDVCIGRPDGSEHRVLTDGQPMWFAATYGSPENRGGGSNVPAWTRKGDILFPCRRPGSVVPWRYLTNHADTDHFNREFRPDDAKGGVDICRLNISSGKVTRLTDSDPAKWDFRASESPDGKLVAFCRAATGASPAIWVMDANGRKAKCITNSLGPVGADHPRWIG